MESKENSLQDLTITHRLFKIITTMSDDERRTLLKLLEKGVLKNKCRRTNFRKRMSLLVAFANERHAYRTRTKDISLGGVFILTSVPFKVGEELRILFNMGNKGGRLLIFGRVARVTSEGIGVKFVSMNNDKKAAILSLACET